MAGGVLYATNAVGLAEAFDPETGRTVWRQKVAGDLSGNPGLGGAIRAVAYWREGPDARILTYQKQHLYALDPKTGEPVGGFGDGGKVDLGVNGQFLWNAPPLVIRDLVLIGSSMPEQDSASRMEGPAGEGGAFDVCPREPPWGFFVIPRGGG